MRAIADLFGGLLKPLFLAVAFLIALGLVSDQSGTGSLGAEGFTCRGWTDDAELNRLLCRYHPAQLWNTPVSELIPAGWRGQEETASADEG